MAQNICNVEAGYVTGSFKGALFESSLSAEIDGGRRGAEGEFPFGEMTAYADLGRKIETYHITAVFRKDSHIGDSQALFEACTSPGPGILVHPTRGAGMAACRSVKVKDEPETPGETHVEMEFVEAQSTGIDALGGALFGIINTNLAGASQAAFLANYTPLAAAQPWRTDILNSTAYLVGALTDVVVQTTTTLADLIPQDWRNIATLKTIVADPLLCADATKVNKALVYGYSTIANNLAGDPVSLYTNMRALVNTAATTSTMPAGTAQESEAEILTRTRILAAINMANAALAVQYNTVDDCLAAMDQVGTVFDDEMAQAYDDCDNELYLELNAHVIQFRTMMNDLAYRLPPNIVVNFAGGVHPLVAAYAIYGDAKRFRDLELGNILDANGRMGYLVGAVAPQ
jgi:prophage DNA circulation protein